ncbi:MAG TPA: ABC transporter permease [Opitutaceae bacterium]|nr:ABC transporter permease [Opitutaceae bacterium]
MLTDLKYALRQLRRHPGFAAFAILALALGIGANTSIFTAIDRVYLRTLPVANPRELVMLTNPTAYGMGTGSRQGPRDLLTYDEFRFLQDHSPSLSGLAGVGGVLYRIEAQIALPGAPAVSASPSVRLVSGNYFSVLGVRAELGRLLGAADDRNRNVPAVAVVSYRYWQGTLHADPQVLGRQIKMNGALYEIVGVTPPGFTGEAVGASPDLWVPFSLEPRLLPGRDLLAVETDHLVKTFWIQAIGRLHPGLSLRQASAQLDLAFHQYLAPQAETIPASSRRAFLGNRLVLSPGDRGGSTVGFAAKPLLLLALLVALLLLIACGNLAILLLARASGRRREIALRLALGARPSRILRQFLTESLLLSLAGGLAGLILARWCDAALGRWALPDVPLRSDPKVLCFCAGVSVAVGLLFGALPALRLLRLSPNALLAQAGGDRSSRRWVADRLLVIGQVTFSLFLLVAAGFLLRSFQKLARADPGFDQDHLVILWTQGAASGYRTAEARDALNRSLQAQISALPGVRGVTYSRNGLFYHHHSWDEIAIDTLSPGSPDKGAGFDLVGPNYFSTLGIPIVAGREITPQDEASGQPVCVINQTLAREYFGGEDPIGHRIIDAFPPAHGASFVVVGVAADFKLNSLRDQPERCFFIPIQRPLYPAESGYFEVRTRADPAGVLASIQETVKRAAPNLKMSSPATMNEILDQALSLDRMLIILSGCFGAVAVVLAAAGIYGTMACAVTQRTREIGVRVALGAQRSDVLQLVLAEVGKLAAAGMLLGLPAIYAARSLFSDVLFDVSPLDPFAIGLALGGMALVALAAGFLPAFRAARLDPVDALRAE